MSIAIRESLYDFASLPDTYQDSHKRFKEIRHASWENPSETHCIDRLLTRPESSSWKYIRILLKAARRAEVAGECFADLSNVFDRLARNTLSTGKEHDTVRMGSAVLAKYLAGLVTYGTFGAPKLIGAGFYALSTAASVLALGLRQLESRSQYPSPPQRSECKLLEKGPVLSIRKALQHRKDRLLNKVYRWAYWHPNRWINKAGYWLIVKRLSRQGLAPLKQKDATLGSHSDLSHSAYMYSHLDYYKPRTQWMLKLSKLGFNVANKLLASPDKYVAHLLGTYGLGRWTGEVLGNRIAFTLCSSAAFLAGFFAAPVMLGILQTAAFAALAAWGLYALAKADIRINHTWRGYSTAHVGS